MSSNDKKIMTIKDLDREAADIGLDDFELPMVEFDGQSLVCKSRVSLPVFRWKELNA